MLFMQGFVFLEEIIMNNGLPVIYDYCIGGNFQGMKNSRKA